MTITADNLITPGPIDGTLFPNTELRAIKALVNGILTEAYADARVAALTDAITQDRAARAYTLGTVYDRVVQRMTAEPLSVDITNKGGHGYNVEQINIMAGLAAKQWAAFDELVEDVTPGLRQLLPGTQAIETDIRVV